MPQVVATGNNLGFLTDLQHFSSPGEIFKNGGEWMQPVGASQRLRHMSSSVICRLRRKPLTALALVLACSCSACATVRSVGDTAPSSETPSSQLPVCGLLYPRVTKQVEALQINIAAPAKAVAGTDVNVTVVVKPRQVASAKLNVQRPLRVAIVDRHGNVVGREPNASADAAFTRLITTQHPWTTDVRLRLAGCPKADAGLEDDASRSPLPAGPYRLVGYFTDGNTTVTSAYTTLEITPQQG